ncbi:MAG: ABC transporter ATP-binding protein [Bacteroidetes bacterium]|nr:ABC transporter ATP-binding protein [Bacteroidota bacterium]MBU1678229.1 ABC transporter ATP-binding protein [Bacteroidota bacterium]MBU2506611.1 ABC transporter ATP-binding protein [Bacteroidota bacterium]
MNKYSLTLKDVTKTFGRRLIFKDINYQLNSGKIYGLAGKNGSGKSTLAKIISGIISPTKGSVIHHSGEKVIIEEELHDYLGFVSPYLVLYDEFTAEENLIHFSKIRGNKPDIDKIHFWLNEFNLLDRKHDILKGYSSGMKQRMKFIFALLHSPSLILLDEPTSNLDQPGKQKVYEIIKRESADNLVIIASNEESDLELCSEIIYLENFKNHE